MKYCGLGSASPEKWPPLKNGEICRRWQPPTSPTPRSGPECLKDQLENSKGHGH